MHLLAVWVGFPQVVQAKKGTGFDMQTACSRCSCCIDDSTASKVRFWHFFHCITRQPNIYIGKISAGIGDARPVDAHSAQVIYSTSFFTESDCFDMLQNWFVLCPVLKMSTLKEPVHILVAGLKFGSLVFYLRFCVILRIFVNPYCCRFDILLYIGL